MKDIFRRRTDDPAAPAHIDGDTRDIESTDAELDDQLDDEFGSGAGASGAANPGDATGDDSADEPASDPDLPFVAEPAPAAPDIDANGTDDWWDELGDDASDDDLDDDIL